MPIVTTPTQLGGNMLKITITGITADNEESAQVDIHSYTDLWERKGYPKRCSVTATPTAGATDVVNVDLYGSNVIAKNGTNIAGVTSTAECELGGEVEDCFPARYWTVLVPTVGAGNTLTITVILEF